MGCCISLCMPKIDFNAHANAHQQRQQLLPNAYAPAGAQPAQSANGTAGAASEQQQQQVPPIRPVPVAGHDPMGIRGLMGGIMQAAAMQADNARPSITAEGERKQLALRSES